MRRLQKSLDGIQLKNPYTDVEWTKLLEQIVAGNEGDDQSLYLHITRGVAPRNHAFPKGVLPTVFIMSSPSVVVPKELIVTGISAITANDNRWSRCDIKAISLLPNVLLRQMASDSNAIETLLLRDGFLSEGAASNIFTVKNQLLLVPPKSNLMLPGITYDVVLEIANKYQMPYEIREISENDLRSSDEILLTSSTKEIMPITLLDGKKVGSGKPGEVFSQLYQHYQNFKNSIMRRESL